MKQKINLIDLDLTENNDLTDWTKIKTVHFKLKETENVIHTQIRLTQTAHQHKNDCQTNNLITRILKAVKLTVSFLKIMKRFSSYVLSKKLASLVLLKEHDWQLPN